MAERVAFSLLDNALDFVLSAVEHARADSPRDWKYAMLHLVAGVELLLKARLEREHWTLLFADVDKADRDALRTGDFKSVDFETASSRLAKIASVETGRVALSRLNELRKLRNRIQHLAIDVDVEQVRALMANGTNFFLDEVRSLMGPVTEAQDRCLNEIQEHLLNISEHVEQRKKAIEPALDGYALGECPRCWQWTVPLGESENECRFCGYRTDPLELQETMGEGAVEGECLACGEESLAFILYNNEDGGFHCTACGNIQRYCMGCGRHFIGDGNRCDDCRTAS